MTWITCPDDIGDWCDSPCVNWENDKRDSLDGIQWMQKGKVNKGRQPFRSL